MKTPHYRRSFPSLYGSITVIIWLNFYGLFRKAKEKLNGCGGTITCKIPILNAWKRILTSF
jgi:hypothetical protein